jgi:hypothetical protein
MDLEGILTIGGKPGLYKLIAQSRGGIIVESLIDEKRFPISQTSNVSALKDIAIYTYGEEVPLEEVYEQIAKKENCEKSVDHKSKPEELRSYLKEILPEYDEERVYNSDLKKLFQWYNILQENGLVALAEEGEEEAAPEAEEVSETED